MTAPSVNIEALPLSVDLTRSPQGAAQFAYVDERKLPYELEFATTERWEHVVEAIKTLAVRGAPAIGIAGASALALWASNEGVKKAREGGCVEDAPRFLQQLQEVAEVVQNARPTAVNLMWAVRRMLKCARELAGRDCASWEIADSLFDEVRSMERDDIASNVAIGEKGAKLLPWGARVLTHCNAGSLATVRYGTALGVVYAAAQQGKVERVYADETRPVGQGARLTTWELSRAGVPTTLICDNMAASLMARGAVDAVIVGADRITANGDVANKIGTYGVAVLARHHGVPFYVAAPTSTIDASLCTGADIPIEERAASEVLPRPIPGVDVWNPAFDVTPAQLIDSIITERGVFKPEEILRAIEEVG